MLRVLLKKELLDALRDKRTLLVMGALPILLYPLLMTVIGVAMTVGKTRLEKTPLKVAVVSDDAQALLALQPVPPFTEYVKLSPHEGEARLKGRTVAAVVDAPLGASQANSRNEQAVVRVRYTKRFDESVEALARLQRVLGALEIQTLTARLEAAKLPKEFAEPVKAEVVDVDFQQDIGPFIASRMLPLMLVLMLFMGALYPAIDVTAGERERGTLETLLVAPVTPRAIMVAKYLTVVIIACVTALANLVAMGLTFAVGFRLDANLTAQLTFSPAQFAVMLACLLPTAFAVSAVTMSIASLAKNFKEAQSMLTPVSLMASMPGIVALMPGMELNVWTAAIPLVNVALLVKAVVLGTAGLVEILVCLGSIGCVAAVAMWILGRVYANESLRLTGASGFAHAIKVMRQH